MISLKNKATDILKTRRGSRHDHEMESLKRAAKLFEKIMQIDVCTETIFDYLSVPELIYCQKVCTILRPKAKSYYERHLGKEAAHLINPLIVLKGYDKENIRQINRHLVSFLTPLFFCIYMFFEIMKTEPKEFFKKTSLLISDATAFFDLIAVTIGIAMYTGISNTYLKETSKKSMASALGVPTALCFDKTLDRNNSWLATCSKFVIAQLEKSNNALDKIISTVQSLSKESLSPPPTLPPSLPQSESSLTSSSSSASSLWSWPPLLPIDQNIKERNEINNQTIRCAIKNFQEARTVLLKWLTHKNIIKHTAMIHQHIIKNFAEFNIEYTPTGKVEILGSNGESPTKKDDQPKVVLEKLSSARKMFAQNCAALKQKEREYQRHLEASLR